MKVAVVGGGWSGATCARMLTDEGVGVEVFESAAVVGGHSRCEVLSGVVYEPNGAHIFHTDDRTVAAFVTRFGMSRPYEHRVLTTIYPHGGDDPVLLSWPPQIEELKALPQWLMIDEELRRLPPTPSGSNFEDYATSLMGATLYEMFIYGYTVKQWGCEPRELSSSFAPKRIDLRADGDRRLFKDRYQFFESAGFNSIIEAVAASAEIHAGRAISLSDIQGFAGEFDACVVTAPLDELVGRPGELAWRGIHMASTYTPLADPADRLTAGYVVNHPDLRHPYTRTVETKHATGQQVHGSVVSEEFPGAPHRHYPVPTVDKVYERVNGDLKAEISGAVGMPLYFCGRLANYQYIDQDDAIMQGIECAHQILADLAQ